MGLIEVGDEAPAFTLPDASGRDHTLASYRGSMVVIYFYPKDDTPGCTREACDFRDAWPTFEDLGVPVLGISPDDEKSHARFISKHDLPITLLADVPEERDESEKPVPPVCDAYGVWQEKSMYGRTYMGVARTTYLIDADGHVAERWERVKVKGHVDAVLEAIRAGL